MANLNFVGIDLTKNVFHLLGCNSTGEAIFHKLWPRNFLAFLTGICPGLISELATWIPPITVQSDDGGVGCESGRQNPNDSTKNP